MPVTVFYRADFTLCIENPRNRYVFLACLLTVEQPPQHHREAQTRAFILVSGPGPSLHGRRPSHAAHSG